MKINGNAIRTGMVIEHQGGLWRAVKIQHTQPGKGGAYLQVELRDIRTGTKLNERFRSSETVERARLDQKEFQFLFADGEMVTFMDAETFDQVPIDQDIIESHEGSIIGVQLPDTVSLEVTDADAVVKGQTASSSYKPATLENGVRCMVPPHIVAGTRIVISTADGSYVERAKD